MSLGLLACALVLADDEVDAVGVIKALRTIYSKVKARGRGEDLCTPDYGIPKLSPSQGERP